MLYFKGYHNHNSNFLLLLLLQIHSSLFRIVWINSFIVLSPIPCLMLQDGSLINPPCNMQDDSPLPIASYAWRPLLADSSLYFNLSSVVNCRNWYPSLRITWPRYATIRRLIVSSSLPSILIILKISSFVLLAVHGILSTSIDPQCRMPPTCSQCKSTQHTSTNPGLKTCSSTNKDISSSLFTMQSNYYKKRPYLDN